MPGGDAPAMGSGGPGRGAAGRVGGSARRGPRSEEASKDRARGNGPRPCKQETHQQQEARIVPAMKKARNVPATGAGNMGVHGPRTKRSIGHRAFVAFFGLRKLKYF